LNKGRNKRLSKMYANKKVAMENEMKDAEEKIEE
jgi:hypothetical protein